jgi:hypothetical protein
MRNSGLPQARKPSWLGVLPRDGVDRRKWFARGGVLALSFGALTAAGIAVGGTKPSTADLRLEPIDVVARPIAAFDRRRPEETRFGKLTWRGGLVLTSPSKNFGGWSGLALDADGRGFFAISDAGAWMSGALAYDAAGKPIAMQSVRLGPIQSSAGEPLRSRDRDAEGLAVIEGSAAKGSVFISFERKHRIARFDLDEQGLSVAKSSVVLPPGAERMKANRGLEAIAVLRGGPNKGSLLAMPETLRDSDGNHIGWMWVKGEPRQFQLTNGGDFDVTDATPLPDGGLLVLERRFRWEEGVKMRLRLIKQQQLQPGATIDGESLIEADTSREIDNMEGLAVHVAPGGDIVVTMISDDNFNHGLQRTVLLQFALSAGDLAASD